MLVAVAMGSACLSALAQEAALRVADPVLEARVMAVAAELRCLVCQNETIAESNAELAVDLRDQIRRQLAQGQTPDDVMAYMTDRYGSFIRYRPPWNATTLALWLGPFALLLAGGLALWRQLRRQATVPHPTGLDAASRRRAQQLLQEPHP